MITESERDGRLPMPMKHETSYVSGGYYLVRPRDRPPAFGPNLVPDKIRTVTDCLVDLAPSLWSIEWTNVSSTNREESAEKFGLLGEKFDEFIAWATAAFDQDHFGWPSTFFDLETASECRMRLPASDVEILGISLTTKHAEELLSEYPEDSQNQQGVAQALGRDERPASGEVLGFDVLDWDGYGFHSYLCNALQDEFFEKFGAHPNEFGFFSEGVAHRCAAHASLQTTGAEPGLWQPWQVKRYGVH